MTLIQAPTGILSDASGVIVPSSLIGGSLVVTIEDPATGCFDTTSTTVEQNINFTLTMASLFAYVSWWMTTVKPVYLSMEDYHHLPFFFME